jgi:hypothetical protein
VSGITHRRRPTALAPAAQAGLAEEMHVRLSRGFVQLVSGALMVGGRAAGVSAHLEDKEMTQITARGQVQR